MTGNGGSRRDGGEMETDNPFEKVLDRLRERGWVQGAWGDGSGPNCINGALSFCTDNAADNMVAIGGIAADQFPDRVHGAQKYFYSLYFNNHPDTTFSDVERVLEKAAIKWEEERVLRHD